MYVYMAHFVGEKLNIRPSEILDTWGVAELLVAFGQYANEITNQNFQQWKAMDPKYRHGEKPKERAVWFMGLKDLEEDDGR